MLARTPILHDLQHETGHGRKVMNTSLIYLIHQPKEQREHLFWSCGDLGQFRILVDLLERRTVQRLQLYQCVDLIGQMLLWYWRKGLDDSFYLGSGTDLGISRGCVLVETVHSWTESMVLLDTSVKRSGSAARALMAGKRKSSLVL